MSLTYRFLNQTSQPDLYRTFVEAFSDYAVDMSYMSEESFLNRTAKNGIDLKSSVGAYDHKKLVGYTLIGVDNWKGEKAAFDIVTGIIKSYRGKGVAKEMFDFAIQKLKTMGVNKFVLEVLQKNQAAIKAYKKSGFRIVRELDCFELKKADARFMKTAQEPVEIHRVGRDILSDFRSSLDWHPSWENSFASIARIPDDLLLLGAGRENQIVGLLIYYPALNWILSLVVKRSHRRLGVATYLIKNLVNQIHNRKQSVKILNIDHSDKSMTAFLRQSDS